MIAFLAFLSLLAWYLVATRNLPSRGSTASESSVHPSRSLGFSSNPARQNLRGVSE